ncbi:sensor histidine kinase [Kutzneria albida]|uniref:histidine kinase n=1 Tax=Kutzneria albida DSM 43870 TaxID=1449976 RepID=W5WEE0_9PSEU|nr:ATP-binding protein [Kutzneria albida]AHH96544.1 histidine kinase [Kutzneria albida DSM 43870]
MTARPDLRRRLLVRLLASSVLIAVCSIAATAWLAVRSTSGAIRTEQGKALATDAHIYDVLLGYAATHPRWDGVSTVVDDLARQTGRVVVLTTPARTPIAQSAAGVSLPQTASAALDPLAVDPVLMPNAPADRIDTRAVGPFALTDQERARLRGAADAEVQCLRGAGFSAFVAEQPNGRAKVVTPGIDQLKPTVSCVDTPVDSPMPSEQKALGELNQLVNDCLAHKGYAPIRLRLDLTWTASEPRVNPSSDQEPVTECVTSGRRQQLTPFVSPAALLFLSDPQGNPAPTTGLSTANTVGIGGTVAVVLLLTVGVTVLVATRLTRPIRALTEAAQRMRDGDTSARVRVRGKDEIGQLAAAFNELSEHRESLERQRKNMVSDVSHELRAPLGNIRGWLEAAQDGVAEFDPALVASLLEESILLQRLVDDLQDLALADAGKLRLHPEPVAVAELVEQVITAHRGQAEGRQVTAEVIDSPEVVADPVRLRQVLGNLVGNAVRHGDVTVRAEQVGEQVVISVRDTGPGIAPEDLPHVFDRFWRADRSRSRQTGGSGLGLAIVRNLVRLHGGTVTAESTLGEGATFTLRLPASSGH